jgi:hypothetical protein
VTAVEFRYFEGATAYTEWNMQESTALPAAVEVRIWLSSADSASAGGASTAGGVAMPGTRMYSQTIELPVAAATSSGSSSSEESESTDETTSGDEGTNPFGTGDSGEPL